MKIRNITTGQEQNFSTLDNALRTLLDRSGHPLLSKVGRKTFKQGIALLLDHDYELVNAPDWAMQIQGNAKKLEAKEEFNPNEVQLPWEEEKAPKVEVPQPEKAINGNPMNDLATLLSKLVDVEHRTKAVVDAEVKTINAAVALKLEQFKGVVVDMVKDFKPMTTEIVIKDVIKGDVNMGVQHHNFPTLLAVLSQRLNCLMVGPAGSGKTMGAEKAAEALGLKYYTISVGAQTTKTEFFGYMNATGNYVRTLFREAFEFGGVFLLDEMDAGNANVIVSINQALANGVTAFPDGMVAKHPDFILVATANTWGNGTSREYVGRNQLDASTIDRFMMIDWSYDEPLEDALTPNKKWLAEVRRIRAIVMEKKIRTVISPRASINGSKLLAAGMDWATVKEIVILKSMNESERVLCR